MSTKPVLYLFFCLLLGMVFFSVQKAYAVSLSITDLPSSIASDPFTLTVSVTGAQEGMNYLRIDLYKEGTNNYFGETYNGANWYNGSEGAQYLPITITASGWQGAMQGRVGSPSTTDYDGTGSYRLRIRRYTASGNYSASEANDASVPVTIVFPTNTPVPTNTPTPTTIPTPTKAPTPTKTPTPTPTQKVIQSTNTPINTPTKINIITVVPTSGITLASSKISPTKSVLSAKTKSEDLPSKTPTPAVSPQAMNEEKADDANSWLLFVILGLAIVAISCGILGYRLYKKRQML